MHEFPRWRGCKSIFFGWNGPWGDPDIFYKDYCFNYWDIESALWDEFLEETDHSDDDRDELTEKEFSEYVQQVADDYLEDIISFGYFEPGSKSWHDRHQKAISLVA